MTLILFIYVLAIWRISYALTEEKGPGGLLEKLRESFKSSKWSPLGCFYCTSVWVSAIVCFALGLPFLFIFGLSAGAIFVHTVHERLWLPL